MGIRTNRVDAFGVKYDLDGYNERVKTESVNELIKIAEAMGKNYIDYPLYYDDEDILAFLEEEAFDDKDIDMVYYGNTVCDTHSDPFGIILEPKTKEAQEYLKSILTKIGSNKRFGQHSEINIG